MNRFVRIFGGLAAIAVLGGSDCKEDDSVTELFDLDNDGRVIAVISGIVLDDATQEPVEGAKVYFQRDGLIGSVMTDSVGYYAISDMDQGAYELEVVPPGDEGAGTALWAGVAVQVIVPTLEEIGAHDVPTNEPFYHSVDREIRIYPLTAGVDGMVFVSDEAQVPGADPLTGSPANGATVLLDADPMDPTVRVLYDQSRNSTDATGAFSFTGFPATPGATVSVLTFTDGGRVYAEAQVAVGLTNTGTSVTPDIFLYNAAGGPVITAHNFVGSANFGVADDLTLSFNKAFDTDSVQVDLRRLTGGGGIAETVPTEVTASSGNVFIIEPAKQLMLGGDYRLDFDGWTTDGVRYTQGLAFTVQDGIELFSTNIERTDGSEVTDFATTDDVTMTFSRQVDGANPATSFTLKERGFDVYGDVTVAGDTVTFSPEYDLEAGTPYVFEFTAHSPIDGDSTSGSINFETDAGLAAPGTVTGFTLDPTDYDVNYNTRTMPFRWDNSAGATGYRIWARDDLHNSSLVLVDDVEHLDHLAWQSTSFNLPTQFDTYGGDGMITPFVDTVVSFSIEAYNDAGAGPLLTPEVLVVDNVAPDGGAFTGQNESADNGANFTPIEVELSFVVPEYADTASGSVTIVGSPTSTVMWDNDAMGGTIIIDVPAGADYSGRQAQFSFTDARGNPSTIGPTNLQ